MSQCLNCSKVKELAKRGRMPASHVQQTLGMRDLRSSFHISSEREESLLPTGKSPLPACRVLPAAWIKWRARATACRKWPGVRTTHTRMQKQKHAHPHPLKHNNLKPATATEPRAGVAQSALYTSYRHMLKQSFSERAYYRRHHIVDANSFRKSVLDPSAGSACRGF